MEALRHAILPKTYLAQRYPKVQGTWPCCGLPERLVCDRGSDLTSRDLEDAAFQLGIELDFNPPRTPHFKGTVESFFDGLNDQLSASLPGRTFRNWADRADYKAWISTVKDFQSTAVCEQVKYGEIRALLGGATTMQGTYNTNLKCFRTLVHNAEHDADMCPNARTNIPGVDSVTARSILVSRGKG